MTSYKANNVNMNQRRNPESARSTKYNEMRRTGTFDRTYESKGQFPAILPTVSKANTGRIHPAGGIRASVDDAGPYE